MNACFVEKDNEYAKVIFENNNGYRLPDGDRCLCNGRKLICNGNIFRCTNIECKKEYKLKYIKKCNCKGN